MSPMPTWAWVVIAVGAVALMALLAASFLMRRRTGRLRDRFGPEYDRMVERRGRRPAEAELDSRVERRRQLDIRPLSPAAREHYRESWAKVQGVRRRSGRSGRRRRPAGRLGDE